MNDCSIKTTKHYLSYVQDVSITISQGHLFNKAKGVYINFEYVDFSVDTGKMGANC